MFNEHLKRARVAAGYTQSELAAHLNISAQSISKWEKGLSLPYVDVLPKISEFFKCPIHVFFSEYELEIFEYMCENAPTTEGVNELLLVMISQLQDEREGVETFKYVEEDIHETDIPVEALFLPKVYEIVQNADVITCTLLQKELKIGYSLAATIEDALRNLGVIKQNDKTKMYEVQKEKIHLLEHYIQ